MSGYIRLNNHLINMKSMMRYLLYTLCYVLVCGTVVAQPTFTVSSADGAPGELITIQVSAENLVNVVGMQFSLDWDPDVITFQEVNDFSIPFLGFGNFGAQDADLGRIGMLWFDNSASSQGITAPATNLFKLEFLANPGITQAGTSISFSGVPSSIEISDTSFTDIGMIPINGGINVLDPNDLVELNTPVVTIGQNVPNPFCEETFIPIELTESNEVKIEIINLTGARIFEYTEFIHPGLHEINIPGDIFPVNGTYLYSVLIGEKKVSKKLFYNGK